MSRTITRLVPFLFVPFLMGQETCAAGGGAGSGYGGGGSNVPVPINQVDTADTADTGTGGGTVPLTNCDPEYTEVAVTCQGKSTWQFHAVMNVAVTFIDVKFAGTGEGTQISKGKGGAFEGDYTAPTHDCATPNSFELQAFGTMLSTYECDVDYTP